MSDVKRFTVAMGDGIGPEIMGATLDIIKASGANVEWDTIEVGEKVYKSGNTTGIPDDAWETLGKNKVFLKAPITTPQGGGYKSLNVTIRKSLGLFANVRPVKTYRPYVQSLHDMDMVIVRENEEDLYAGIEHQQTPNVVQAIKLISKPGCEKIIRYAFEYAKAYGRKKVTCMSKDNIMKLSDGLFHRTFDEIRKEYPEIEADHHIIDIGSALIADTPERFDVVVTLNLYGDIISDIAAQVAGSVGLAGSANVGLNFAMFEAIHGSAPDIAGKGIANPSGLINGAIQMLVHLGEADAAEKIQNAWLKTLEDGIHTGDVYKEGESAKLVGTREFADALIERLGETPSKLNAVKYNVSKMNLDYCNLVNTKKELVGVDVFLDWKESGCDPVILGERIQALCEGKINLKIITNRGVKVFPGGREETYCSDHWICRFTGDNFSNTDVINLLQLVHDSGLEFIKIENLYNFDGVRGFSLAQGE